MREKIRKYDYHGTKLMLKFIVDDTSGAGCVREIIDENEYELNRFKGLTGTIVDIGANIGIATVILAKQNPNATIYSVEPHYETFVGLTKNVTINKLKNVVLLNYGIGKEDGKVRLLINTAMSGQNTLYSDREDFVAVAGDFTESADITVKTWSSFLSENGIARIEVLKIDAEGCEFEVTYNEHIKNVVGEIHEMKNTGNGQDLLNHIQASVPGFVKLGILKTTH